VIDYIDSLIVIDDYFRD